MVVLCEDPTANIAVLDEARGISKPGSPVSERDSGSYASSMIGYGDRSFPLFGQPSISRLT